MKAAWLASGLPLPRPSAFVPVSPFQRSPCTPVQRGSPAFASARLATALPALPPAASPSVALGLGDTGGSTPEGGAGPDATETAGACGAERGTGRRQRLR